MKQGKINLLCVIISSCLILSACSGGNKAASAEMHGGDTASVSEKNDGTVSATTDTSAEATGGDGQPASSENSAEVTENAVAASTRKPASEEEIKELMSEALTDDAVYSESCTIKLGDTVEISGSGAACIGSTVMITEGGEYVVSGTLTDGMLYIEAKGEEVKLVLNGADITDKSGCALYCCKAELLTVELADGTENTLADGSEYTFDGENETAEENEPNAALYSKADLLIKGDGSLTVTGNYNNGITGKDTVSFESGTVSVTAANNAIKGNDCVTVSGADITVTSLSGDGIKTDSTELGNLLISGGKIEVVSADSGIIADGLFCMTGGTVTVDAQNNGIKGCGGIIVSGGEINATAKADAVKTDTAAADISIFGGILNITATEDGIQADNNLTVTGGRVNVTTNGAVSSSVGYRDFRRIESAVSTEEDTSSKGIKCGGNFSTENAEITVSSTDHALHSTGAMTINSGKITLSSSCGKGMSAHGCLTVNGGDIDIFKSTEGIESKAVLTINGGEISVTASDDGLNAGGGVTMGGFAAADDSGTHEIVITGGYVYINASGDGIDSNGDINMSGGTVLVCGPTNDGNGALDSGDNGNIITVTGGLLLAVGSTGMMETPEANYSGTTSLGASAGDVICVKDLDGNVIAALKLPKSAAGLIVSYNGGEGITVYSGGSYNGTLNGDGYGSGGSYGGGAALTLSESIAGFGGFGGGQWSDREIGGFGGQMPGGGRR